jgi:serine/threonine protein kinase
MTNEQPALLLSLPAGTLIAERYRVVRLLGRGGMGLVYEVEHVHIGRRFACKVVSAAVAGGPFEEALFREARLLGQLESEHVVKVVDCGRDSEHGTFVVVEKFHGGTLGELLALEGRVPWERAVAITLALCTALMDVHRAEVVHRDLKPHNIGLTQGGHAVKLFDFGIATKNADDGAALRTLGSGTVPYMAPELWAGMPATIESDLFAIGVTLCEMLTGSRPFDGLRAPRFEPSAIVSAMQELAPDAKIPGWLMQVVARLLHRSAHNRFHSAAELASALRRTHAYDHCSTIGLEDDVSTGSYPLAAS